MKRGEVWQVDLGFKAGKRPVLILTRSDVIPYLNKLTVAEITTQKKGYPTEVDIDQKANLPKASVVQLDNIQTIPRDRFIKFIGTLDETEMKIINEKIIFALDLLETI